MTTRSTPRRGRHSDGVATRAKLIEAAERLFATKGLAPVSLREIGEAAGQRNSNVVQFHFGDRDGLIAAIIGHRVEAIENRRWHLLRGLVDRQGPITIADLMAVLLDPLVHQVEQDTYYVGFLTRLNAEQPVRPARIDRARSNSTFAEVGRLLREQTPHLTGSIFEMRYWLIIDLIIGALAEHQARLRTGLPGQVDLQELTDDLNRSCAGFLSAP